jgi:hypothetical protein
MKSIKTLVLCLILGLLVMFAMPAPVNAAPLLSNAMSQTNSDKVVFGDTYTLSTGDVLNGNLTVLGGTATLETGSQVQGDVVLLGGTLNANGGISGNLSTLGGTLFLGDQAVVHGNLSMLGGTLHRSGSAQVLGQTVNGGLSPFNVNLPNFPFQIDVFSGFQSLFNFFRTLINMIILSALSMLVVLVWPRPTERVARAIGVQPIITGGLGLLTAVVLPALLIIMAITIILIPVSLLGFIALGIAILYGWFAAGFEVGRRMAQLFKQEWQPAIAAGLGTLTISVIATFIGAIPCIGWLIPFLIAMIGLGGVIITRFGTQFYPPTNLPFGPTVVTPGSGSSPTPQPAQPADDPSDRFNPGIANSSPNPVDTIDTNLSGPTL